MFVVGHTIITVANCLYIGEEAPSLQSVVDYFKNKTEGFKNVFFRIIGHWLFFVCKFIVQVPWFIPECIGLVKSNQLVRMRGMVHDMPGTEPYAERYRVVSENVEEQKWFTGRYRDHVELTQTDDVNYEMDESQTVFSDRHILITTCTLPGTSEFMQKEMRNFAMRQWEQFGEFPSMPMNVDKTPFSSVVVKVYEDISPKLNETYDFIGVLTLETIVPSSNPTINGQPTPFEMDLPWYYKNGCPILHVLSVEKLSNHRDLLQPFFITGLILILSKLHFFNLCFSDDTPMKLNMEVRENLVNSLSQIFSGDRLVAELYLCHLISSVYGRSGPISLGNLPINICGITSDMNIVEHLRTFLHQILPNVSFVEFLKLLQNTCFLS